ncbi:hypothetical protein [Streptomyces albipurpureus]|uniref:Lipoprotein n=1 Tax=Streptomyces albipurpureus TaxID=2897419 RepID=A0ABT0URJ5_9ACTN|nr:hypothetical protein [Streptomyces sp. CWNU-1]MCM2390846.1 hypothetical protein [Streptomyces sp. CWNU-1]
MRSRTRTALAVLPFALALALTGCSSDDGGDKVATAQSSGKDRPDAEPSMSERDRAMKFAKCMRQNGVDMEDPKDGQRFVVKARKKGSKAVMDKAMEKCRDYQPQGGAGGRKADPKAVAAMQKYAKCMRENGVAEFPDPKPGGGLQMNKSIQDDPDFKTAEGKCQSHLAAERKRVEGKDQ